ncbi:MAG: hypothetical protein AAGJ95_08005 [Cyanobacteria bacterium J06554_11]
MNIDSHSITQPLTISTRLADVAFPRIKDPSLVAAIVERTAEWTDGDPFFRRFIYDYVSQYSFQIVQSEGAGIVDEIVRQKIVRNWENNVNIPCLNRIKERLLAFQDRDILLILYMQILSRGALSFSHHPHTQRMQAHLLASGLIKQKNNHLVVSNAIFAEIFSLAWIEQQIPGLTRSVTVVTPEPSASGEGASAALSLAVSDSLSSSARSHADPSYGLFRRYNYVVVLGCALSALVVTLLVRQQVIRDSFFADLRPSAIAVSEKADNELSDVQDRRLFDSGIAHATNGRWLSMLQDFCQISKGSHYYAPAENQLMRWYELYPAQVQNARQALSDEENETCGMPTNI